MKLCNFVYHMVVLINFVRYELRAEKKNYNKNYIALALQ